MFGVFISLGSDGVGVSSHSHAETDAGFYEGAAEVPKVAEDWAVFVLLLLG